MLNVRINVEGEIDKNAYIAFSRLDILIDGKPIDEFPVRTLSPLIVDKKINYTGINVDRKIGLEQINEINDKKIIGLGESVHGNDGIKNLAYQLIIQAVERLNCKLVLQEMPLEQSFAYNRFIQDDNYELDSSLVINHATINFLKDCGALILVKRKILKLNYMAWITIQSFLPLKVPLWIFLILLPGLTKNRRFRKLINYPCC